MESLKKLAGVIFFVVPLALYTTASAIRSSDWLQQSTYKSLLNKKMNSISCVRAINVNNQSRKQAGSTDAKEQAGCHAAGMLLCEHRRTLRCGFSVLSFGF